MVIKCPKCGKEIPKEANFCPYCMEKFVGENNTKHFVQMNKSPNIFLIIASCIITAIICVVVSNILNDDKKTPMDNSHISTSYNEKTEASSPEETTTIDYLNPDRFGPNFTEDSTLAWPVQGDIIMGFSVNQTVFIRLRIGMRYQKEL